MAPVLEAPGALAIRVLRGLALLREVALAVSDDAAHVVDVAVIVRARVFVRVLLKDLYDLAATVSSSQQPVPPPCAFSQTDEYLVAGDSSGERV